MRNRRGIGKMLWLGAGLSFISVAILVGSVIRQLNVPKYEKDLREAQSVKSSDKEKAARLFKSAMEGAESAGLKGEGRFSKIRAYGDFLADHQNNYDEAQKVFKHGIDIAHGENDRNWQGTFSERLAHMQYWGLRSGAVEKPDPQPALDGIMLRPEDFRKPTSFAADTYWDLGQTYVDAKDFARGDQALEKARKLYADIGRDLPEGFYRAQIESLVGQRKYRQANDLFVKMMEEFSEDDYKSKRLRADFYCAIDQAQPDAEQVRSKARKLFKARNFTALEELGDDIERDKGPLPTGCWRSDYYYDGIDDAEDYSSEAVWTRLIDRVEQWKEQFPRSDKARIAHAHIMSSYAWKLRNDDDKENLYDKEGDKKLFEQRIAAAWDSLQEVNKRSVGWYETAMNVAWAPTKKDHYDAVYTACRKQFPEFYSAVLNKAAWLHSEKDGDATTEYLDKECNKLPRAEGDQLYGLVLGWLDSGTVADVLSETNCSWARGKRGLQAVIAKFPQALPPRAALSSLALEGDEPKISERAFDGVK